MACWTLVGGDALAGVEDALVAESGETPLDLLVLLFESGGIEPASQCLLPKGQLRAVEWPGSVDHVIVLKVTAKSFVEALVGLIAPFPLQEVRKAALLVAGHRQLAERLLCPCPGGSRLLGFLHLVEAVEGSVPRDKAGEARIDIAPYLVTGRSILSQHLGNPVGFLRDLLGQHFLDGPDRVGLPPGPLPFLFHLRRCLGLLENVDGAVKGDRLQLGAILGQARDALAKLSDLRLVPFLLLRRGGSLFAVPVNSLTAIASSGAEEVDFREDTLGILLFGDVIVLVKVRVATARRISLLDGLGGLLTQRPVLVGPAFDVRKAGFLCPEEILGIAGVDLREAGCIPPPCFQFRRRLLQLRLERGKALQLVFLPAFWLQSVCGMAGFLFDFSGVLRDLRALGLGLGIFELAAFLHQGRGNLSGAVPLGRGNADLDLAP